MENKTWIVTKSDLVIRREKNIVKEVYILAYIYENLYFHPTAGKNSRIIKIDVTKLMLKNAKVYNLTNDLIMKVFEKMPLYFEVYKNDSGKFALKYPENLKQIIIDSLKEIKQEKEG